MIRCARYWVGWHSENQHGFLLAVCGKNGGKGKSSYVEKAALPGISAAVAFEGLVDLFAEYTKKSDGCRPLACADFGYIG